MRTTASLIFAILVSVSAAADFRTFQSIPAEPRLERELERIARESLEQFATSGLKEGHLSISLVDLSARPVRASYRGEITYHPASVVKAFYLVTVHDQIRRGRLKLDPPLIAALRDMIVDSGNDATSYVVDRISRVTSGPELYGRAFRRFRHRRGVANRLFHKLGYDINANGKTWCENVYGREKQLLGPNREYRNRVTSDAVASLMYWIATRRAVSRDASEAMLALMKRPIPADDPSNKEGQVIDFTGEPLPAGSRLWSKAGWTSEVRHDMTYVELPNGRRYVLAVLTRGTGEGAGILPAISKRVLALFTGPAAVAVSASAE